MIESPDHQGARGFARRHRGRGRDDLVVALRALADHGALQASRATPIPPPPTCATRSRACAGACPRRSTSRSSPRSRPTPSRSCGWRSRRRGKIASSRSPTTPRATSGRACPRCRARPTCASSASAASRCASGSTAPSSPPTASRVQDVEDALRRQNVEIPAGRIESDKREFSVLSLTDLQTPAAVRGDRRSAT